MRIAVTATFRQCYEKLPSNVQEKVDRQLAALVANPRHPPLHVKKIKGSLGIWEARVDLVYRMTFSVKNGAIFLRRVGPHDQTLKRP